MTVSRALRGHPSIPALTRDRIRKLAAKMGYEVDPLMRALMTQIRAGREFVHQGAIAFLVPSLELAEKSYGYQKLIKGAAPRAGQLGYRLDVIPLNEIGSGRMRLSRLLAARGIHGILIPPLVEVPAGQIEWSNFTAVAVGDRRGTPSLHLVRNHHSQTILLALERLRELGYRRIGFYLLKLIDDAIRHTWAALWLYDQSQRPLKARIPALMVERLEQGPFLEWLRAYRPEVVLTKHLEVRSWLEAAGFAIPAKIGFVHLDCIAEFGDCTGVDQNTESAGAAALDLVVELLYRNERGVPTQPKTILIDSRWTPGASVRNLTRRTRRASRIQ
jgi:DNA-binding LacI/PurR family transcriptional regulator